MKYFAIVNPGLEEVASKEITELLGVKSIVYPHVVEFDASSEDVITLVYHMQSVRRILVSLGKYVDTKDVHFDNYSLGDYYTKDTSTKTEVEGVKGQENRIALSKEIGSKIFDTINKQSGFAPAVELKKPDMISVVYYNQEHYFIGIDVCGLELNGRDYRVFTHSASFKGDSAYFFIKESGFSKGEKLLVGFGKDGTLAVEASLHANHKPVQSLKKEFSFNKFPLFKKVEHKDMQKAGKTIIECFDEGSQNVTAIKKNVILAGVKDFVDVHKYSLEDLDVKFMAGQFDRVTFFVTSKDEDKLNELYYQTNYILRSKGTLLMVAREQWEPTISDKFSLLKKGLLQRGESVQGYWVLEKK